MELKRKTFYLLGIILGGILLACNLKQEQKSESIYEISGLAKGIPDGTFIFLQKGERVDSTTVASEKFFFSGQIKEPIYTKLFIENSDNSKWFWLEDSRMKIAIMNGQVAAAEIEGSKLQQEEEALKKRIELFTGKRDSFVALLMDPEQEQEIKDSIFILFEEQQKQTISEYENFIRQHPNSYLSAKILESNMIEFGKEKTDSLFRSLSRPIRETETGKLISNFVNLNRDPEVGEKFVDFSQKDQEGNVIDFSSVRGEVTLIEFWASWCKPCRASNPDLRRLNAIYADKGFRIVGISLDSSKEQWVSAIQKDSLNWVNLSDLNGSNNAVAMIYGVKAIPDNFLINKNGIIIGRHLNAQSLEERLEEYYGN